MSGRSAQVLPGQYRTDPLGTEGAAVPVSASTIDILEVKAEVAALFAEYERALVENDVAAVDRFFLDAPATVRYGIAENLYGYDEIAAWRATAAQVPARVLERTVISTFGRDVAVVSTLFRRAEAPGKVGRQTQTWVRTPDGWRVAAAHVSVIDDPGWTSEAT